MQKFCHAFVNEWKFSFAVTGIARRNPYTYTFIIFIGNFRHAFTYRTICWWFYRKYCCLAIKMLYDNSFTFELDTNRDWGSVTLLYSSQRGLLTCQMRCWKSFKPKPLRHCTPSIEFACYLAPTLRQQWASSQCVVSGIESPDEASDVVVDTSVISSRQRFVRVSTAHRFFAVTCSRCTCTCVQCIVGNRQPFACWSALVNSAEMASFRNILRQTGTVLPMLVLCNAWIRYLGLHIPLLSRLTDLRRQ